MMDPLEILGVMRQECLKEDPRYNIFRLSKVFHGTKKKKKKKRVTMERNLDSKCDFAPECKAEDFIFVIQGFGLNVLVSLPLTKSLSHLTYKEKGLFWLIALEVPV